MLSSDELCGTVNNLPGQMMSNRCCETYIVNIGDNKVLVVRVIPGDVAEYYEGTLVADKKM